VLGASVFDQEAPDSFRGFDRAFVTMFRVAGPPAPLVEEL
jgi:hypothetical protein